ncbi:MAG: serine/threonine-protein kinase PknK [Deltaproteobacteria bacterium]|nr:serine/threonine-protein kinase PknK [Deltaproteobacteria bacterium]
MERTTLALSPTPLPYTDVLSGPPLPRVAAGELPTRVPAHLRVLARAGAGGMGVVWEAWDDRRRQRVALKLPRLGRPALAQALRTEFRRAAEVVHPHLLGLYELHDLDGVPAMIMEWVDGQPLHAGLPPATLVKALAQVCEAAAALHAHGLVHQDIKPGNVLLRESGDAVLLDFGLAQAEDEPSRGLGTPDYMAPELLEGEAASPASDVYALAISAYELLSGELPFPGLPAVQRRAKRAGWATPLLDRAPGLPPALCAAVMQGLLADPGARPSVEALRAALDPVRAAAAVPLAPRSGLVRAALTARVPAQPLALVGESGMGKTTLARAIRAQLGPRLWLRGSCTALAQVVFGGLDGVVDDLARLLALLGRQGLSPDPAALRAAAALFPTLGPAGHRAPTLDPDAVLRGADGLAALIRAAGGARPIGVFLDDVQWVDPDTQAVLARVLAQLGAAVPAILVSRAEAPVRAVAPAAVVVEVGPLQPDELVEAGVAAPGQAADEPVPPYAFAALTERSGEPGPALLRWRGALLRRHRGLPAPAQDLVRLLALAAAPLRAHLSAGLGVPEPALRAAVAAALVRVEVGRDGPALRLSHPRLAEALGTVDDPALHLRLADAFVAAGPGDAAAAAHHFAAGGEPSRAAPLYAQAGRAALAGGAWALAAAQLERAEALGHVDPESGEALARAWLALGRHVEAVRKLRAVAAGRPAVEAAPLLADAVWVEVGNGKVADARGTVRALLAEVGEESALNTAVAFFSALRGWRTPVPKLGAPLPGPEDRARLAALWAAANGIAGVETIIGLGLHARHAALAAKFDAPDHHVRALVAPLWDTVGRGASAAELEARVAAAMERASAPDLQSLIRGARGFGLYLGCEVAAARSELSSAAAIARTHGGFGWVERFCVVSLLMCDIYAGDIERVGAETEHAMASALLRGDRLGRVGLALAVGYQVPLLAGGDVTAARLSVEQAVAEWGHALPPDLSVRRIFAEAHLLVAEGKPRDALAKVKELGWAERPLLRYRVVRALRNLCEARARLALGGQQNKAFVLRLAGELADEGTPTCLGWAHALRAGLGVAGAAESARQAFEADGQFALAALSRAPASPSTLAMFGWS